MCKWTSQAYFTLHGLLQGPHLKSQYVLKQHFKNFLNICLHVLNKTNKQTLIKCLEPTHQKIMYVPIWLSFTKLCSVLL